MKAAIRRSYGNPKVIRVENIDKPSIIEDEILVKVSTTTVNRTDCANLTGKPLVMHLVVGFLKPKKIILGTDFAGTVVDIGENVQKFNKGERVFGFSDLGMSSQAEYLVIKETDNLLHIPDQIDFGQAAASIEGAHYAYTFIHKVNLKEGDKILINGVTGAIGSALLQLLHPFDVHITAVGNTKNIELIKELGADKIYDFTQEDFTQKKDEYDYIFDAVGKSTFGKCKPLLKDRGVYISSELGPYAQNIYYSIYSLFAGNKKVIFPIPYNIKTTMRYIKRMLEEGIFSPIIDRKYTLNEVSEAYQYVISGQKTGNVILNIEN